jgi:hypothetical protein
MRALVATIAKGLCLGPLAAGFASHQAAAPDDAAPLSGLSRPASTHEGPVQESAAAPSTIGTQLS